MSDSVGEARKLLATRRTQLVGELERVEQALAALGGRRRGRKPGPKTGSKRTARSGAATKTRRKPGPKPGSKRRGRPLGSGKRKPGPKRRKR